MKVQTQIDLVEGLIGIIQIEMVEKLKQNKIPEG